jgi:hypothetical protein
MTVAIGALCDGSDKKNTANIILCADRLIAWTKQGVPISTNPNGAKIYDLPCGFYVAIADDISSAHVIVSKLTDAMKGFLPTDSALVDKVKQALEETAEYARSWMVRGILAQYGITLRQWQNNKNLADRDMIREDIANSRPAAELIVAGFKGTDPILFYTDCVHVQEQTSPGIFTTQSKPPYMGGYFQSGCGGEAALHWLNLRQQNVFMSAQRTYYHVLEAKRFAELSPVVGVDSAVLLLRPNKPCANLSPRRNPAPDLVKELVGEFWLKSTEKLDEEHNRDKLFDAFSI